jgi:hypothetical protein
MKVHGLVDPNPLRVEIVRRCPVEGLKLQMYASLDNVLLCLLRAVLFAS